MENVSDNFRERPVLSVSELRKEFGGMFAVDGVSFQVKRGEIVGLLGPNGAGKTTTINMILGVLEPCAGSIEIDGEDIACKRKRVMGKTNFAANYTPLPGNLTVRQNLKVFGLLYDVKDLSKRIDELLERLDLSRYRDVKSGLLSSGEQAKVSLAKALLNRPQLLLLDEPTVSLDPATAREVRVMIREFTETGTCGVLWTSHNMKEVEEVCHRVLFLSRGKVLLQGEPKELSRQHGKSSLEELFIAVAREPLAIREI
jgi:ABC-2 type transport system ATP-binding protein